jgi:hypothetical protein
MIRTREADDKTVHGGLAWLGWHSRPSMTCCPIGQLLLHHRSVVPAPAGLAEPNPADHADHHDRDRSSTGRSQTRLQGCSRHDSGTRTADHRAAAGEYR